MKKIMITLVMIITLTTGAFASEENVNPEVLNAFKTKFANAQDITWKEVKDYYKVTFTYHSYRISAYYNINAELMGVIRFISSTQLPLYLQKKLEKNYPDYWIADLFELSNVDGFTYYITLQKADQRIILKSESGDNWEVYQKQNL